MAVKKAASEPMLDIMVDLETLGQRPGCSILSIGAVAFHAGTKQLDAGFYTVVNRASCKRAKLHEDAQTINWWAKQSAEARQVLAEVEQVSAPKLKDSLVAFQQYLWSFGPKSKIRVWGNGSDFDNAILACCFAAVKLTMPWEFWNNRCYRTLKGLYPGRKMQRTGTHHNALDDAKSQAIHAIELLRLRR